MSQSLSQIRPFEEILAALQAAFPDDEFTVEAKPIDDTYITLVPESVRPVIELLLEHFDIYHLSTITGDDVGDGVCLLYHFWSGYGITLRILLPYEDLHMPTLTDLIPGASYYEREIQEMLGVTFEGLDIPGPMFLPDDWRDDGGPVRYPLRRETGA